MISNRCKKYCTGCGLCSSLNKASLVKDKKGFSHPETGDQRWLSLVCPAEGKHQVWMDKTIWGRATHVYYGWSLDEKVRAMASSGGALTEIASFLLESHMVDAVIHTGVHNENPTGTMTYISYTRDEMIQRSGSRYAISHPLENFDDLDMSLKYAFIGKPCDVIALKNYMEVNSNVKQIIYITLSFFCAGLPSDTAQNKLLEQLGCEKSKCELLRYRGNGWPGFATAVDTNGKEYKMDYDSSWGKILGRDIMPACRFCIDGIGEVADIACGDAWYLTVDLKPDFSEHKGRNVIIARTPEGNHLLQKIKKQGLLYLVDFADYKEKLVYMQHFQRERKETMLAKKLAMSIMGRPFPKYSLKLLYSYYKGTEIKYSWWTFKGTIKRVLQGKI